MMRFQREVGRIAKLTLVEHEFRITPVGVQCMLADKLTSGGELRLLVNYRQCKGIRSMSKRGYGRYFRNHGTPPTSVLWANSKRTKKVYLDGKDCTYSLLKTILKVGRDYPDTKKAIFFDGDMQLGNHLVGCDSIVIEPEEVTILRYTKSLNGLDYWVGGDGDFMKGGLFINRKPNPMYYQTRHWQQVRQKYLNGYGCSMGSCGRKANQLHHLNYETICYEQEKDVMPLCSLCHEVAHGGEN